jgi:hypothetical protein
MTMTDQELYKPGLWQRFVNSVGTQIAWALVALAIFLLYYLIKKLIK